MDDVRFELAQRLVHGGRRNANRERIHQRHTHGGHAHDGEPEVIGDLLLPVPGAGGDDDGLVAVLVEVFEDTQHGVGHSVDIRQEGFRDDGYTHAPHHSFSECSVGNARTKFRLIFPLPHQHAPAIRVATAAEDSAGMIDSVHSRPSTLTRSGLLLA